MSNQTVRITVVLSEELLQAIDKAVQEGKASSRNQLIAIALRHELEALERAKIDADFVGMAQDHDYQEGAQRIAKEFANSDWEAFRQGE